jgi:Calcium-activated chloride channel
MLACTLSLAMKWGTHGFEDSEPDRPAFYGDEIYSYINGEEMTYFSPNKREQRVRWSFTVISSFILLVIGVVVGIYVIR